MYEKRILWTTFVMTIILAVTGLLIGCGTPEKSSGGSVTLNFESTAVENPSPATRQIIPGLSMTIASYDLSFVGPTTKTVTGITGTTTTVTSLAAGTYTINAKAWNSTPTQIGEGTVTGIIIVAGESTAISITVIPCVGNGTFTESVTYPTDLVNPVLTSTLSPLPSGTTVNATFGT